MTTEAQGWGCERFTYTRKQLEYLDECFNLNYGLISNVIQCALSNKELFGNFTTAHDMICLVWLIENHRTRLLIMNGDTGSSADKCEIKITDDSLCQ